MWPCYKHLGISHHLDGISKILVCIFDITATEMDHFQYIIHRHQQPQLDFPLQARDHKTIYRTFNIKEI